MHNMQIIVDKIKEYDKIFIFRHFRPDGDAIGSSMGLARILRLTYPEKDIRLANCDYSDKLAFLNDEAQKIADGDFDGALGIVTDTATADRISDKRYSLCRELIKIDHHIPVDSYAPTEWVEEHRSSCSEMICAIYEANKDIFKIDPLAATYIFTGMVTDSNRFRFSSTSPETLRLAALMLEVGIDTERIYTALYLKDERELRLEAFVQRKTKMSESGVASIFVSRAMQKRFSLNREQAGDTVNCLDSIKGSLIWIAFVECADGSIRVRLRSRFVAINGLAERYSGGGHACACGATVHSKKEMKALIADAEALLADYKANNGGWM